MGTKKRSFGGFLTIALILTAASAFAGELRGKIRLPAGPVRVQEASLNPYAGQLGSGHAAVPKHNVKSSPSEVVIYLEGVPRGNKPARRTPQLKQFNVSFEPRVIGIAVGGRVAFPNEDAVLHNVFSYSKTKRFDLGYYGKGKSRSVRFDKPGLVKVFCDIHSSMSAYIFVAGSQYVVQPDQNGDYTLKDIPAGTYTMKVWHLELGERSEQVAIGAGVTERDVTF